MPLPPFPNRLGTTLSKEEIQSTKLDVVPKRPTAQPLVEATEVTPSPAAVAASAPATLSTEHSDPSAHAQSVAADAPIERDASAQSTDTSVVTTTPKKRRKRRDSTSSTVQKLFVLDTNVLLHDSNSLFKFEEHDVYLPMIVLEELDLKKSGMSEVARNARQVSRNLDSLVEGKSLDAGVPLNAIGNIEAQGNLFFQTTELDAPLPIHLPAGKADNAILRVVHALKQLFKDRKIVMVSKDINMRLKAKALGLAAEDYLHDHVIDDTDLLYDGVRPLPADFWSKHGKEMESWQQGGTTYYRIHGPLCAEFVVNEFVYTESEPPLYTQVKEVTANSAVLATLRDYSHNKNNVWGISARNREQNFALNLLMNPDCDFVSLLGQAGTGKTLLALAAALTQTLETQLYSEIIITRATVSVGDDIGFLPGTEEEKMAPWMGALEDNLEVLQLGSRKHAHLNNPESSRDNTMEAIRAKIQIKSMSFMRGRTFLNKFLIIDEAQNLTPKQMKTLVTRAGPGTKVVCLGNIAQIDTPYLTEGSSGLTYVVDRFKGWPHAGHITLQRGERSRLADYANEAL